MRLLQQGRSLWLNSGKLQISFCTNAPANSEQCQQFKCSTEWLLHFKNKEPLEQNSIVFGSWKIECPNLLLCINVMKSSGLLLSWEWRKFWGVCQTYNCNVYYQAILTSNNNMQMRILSTDTDERNGFEVKEITSASAVTYLFCQLLKNGESW